MFRRSFPVTHSSEDAPDGAVVNGYERHGDSWEPIPFPEPGTKVSRRVNGKRETRWVLDTTFGGKVVYAIGRWPRSPWREYGLRCTLDEWVLWTRSGTK